MHVVLAPIMKTHSLENQALRIDVVPIQGGRIESLWDRRTGKDWMWHPTGYIPSSRSLPVGAPFEQNWRGGWVEIFPNEAAHVFQRYGQGYELVDHGELWSQPWQIIEKDANGIKMMYRCERVPVDVEKTIVLSEKTPSFRLHYLFRSHSSQPLPFLFKLYPAIAIEKGDRILLPKGRIEPADLDVSTWIGHEGSLFTTELAEGWAGIRNNRTESELKIRFDRRDIPNVWAFQNFGKSGNHDMLVLGPSTTETTKRKTGAVLKPGERHEIHFEVTIDRSKASFDESTHPSARE
jgi:hypothetical protein